MSEILLLVIPGVICGAETFHDIEIYGEKKLDFLKQFSPFVNGIPSEYTVQDLFVRLNPRVFEACFANWVAMGCQSDIAEAIWEQEADYMLALKGNQESLHEDVKEFFEKEIRENFRLSAVDTCTTLDKGHGRIERRTVYSSGDVAWLRERHPKWESISSIVAVSSERTIQQVRNTEMRFYVSSLEPDAKKASEAIRSHWGIENEVHRVLDVVFKEDDCRVRTEYAPRNFAVIRKIALNLIRLAKEKITIRTKRTGIQSIRKWPGGMTLSHSSY